MNATPPPAAPISPVEHEGPAPPPRQLPAGEGASWWGESWRIFCAAPGIWVGIVLIFAVISIALAFVPIIGSFAQTVLAPVFAGGLMLGCHALAKGRPLIIGHLFEGFQGARFAPLVTLGLLWLAVLFVVAIVMVGTVFLTLGASGLAALMDFDAAAQIDFRALSSVGASLAVVGLIALIALLLAAMAYWFAPALVVLNGETPFAALQKSFAASWHNVGAFLLYGLIMIGLAIVASIPFLLGWIVLGPMLVGSCYAGWRTIFAK